MPNLIRFAKRMQALAGLGDGWQGRLRIIRALVALWIVKTVSPGRRPSFRLPLRQSGLFTLRVDEYTDLTVIEEVFVRGEYDVDAAGPVATIVDLGGNLGASAIYFAIRWPEAHIHVMEPDPRVLPKLRENVAAFPNVRVHPWAATGLDEEVKLRLASESWASSLLSGTPSGDPEVGVPGLRLSTMFERLGISEVDLLKFDIEGAELEVLAESTALAGVRQMVGEVHCELLGLDLATFCERVLSDREVQVLDDSETHPVISAALRRRGPGEPRACS